MPSRNVVDRHFVVRVTITEIEFTTPDLDRNATYNKIPVGEPKRSHHEVLNVTTTEDTAADSIQAAIAILSLRFPKGTS